MQGCVRLGIVIQKKDDVIVRSSSLATRAV